MNKNTLITGLIGMLIGATLTWLFVPMWGNSMRNGNYMKGLNNPMGTNNQSMGTMDAHFIEQMIPHHVDAILMADIALEKATHQEIKQLALDIKRTQTEEIEKMKKWYKDWYGKEVSDTTRSAGHGMGMTPGGMMENSTDIENLKTAEDFDKVFIEQMIPHHQMAVMMSQMLASSTQRQEMKQLASDIIIAQNKEIEQMQGWYKNWYKK